MKPLVAAILFAPLAVIAEETNLAPVLLPAYGPIKASFWEQHEVAIIAASVAVLVFAALVVFIWMQPAAPVIVPPEVAVREALTRLAGRPEDAQTLGEISQVLRRYLGAVLKLPAPEMTTAELAAALPFGSERDKGLSAKVSDFFRECDVRKFAAGNALPPLNAAQRAQELITAVAQAVKPPPLPPR